ncbi:hypothetical protein O1611_g5692 [Lasiodiplodia mahajangana]|uniref:Uncharacterized protein n=1 Tax=Lasiodiplodia mahajangana TaxID=1108764 RepID=A0ACC2JL67_9PEZI|nr:hypothetical protein O1611_g5692 [Lasiodiplodia mahajangana]
MPRPAATIHDHLRSHLPDPGSVGEKWKWPFWKFGYHHGGILFEELHTKFNSFPCAIQDPHAWHMDVAEIANRAHDRETLFALLEKRRDERYAELEKAWQSMAADLIGSPSWWKTEVADIDMWFGFARIARHFSYDSLLQYFNEYYHGDTDEHPAASRNGPGPRIQSPKNSQQWLPNQTALEEPDPRDTQPEQDARRLQAETGSTQGERTRKKGAGPAKTTSRERTSPNRIVKRQTRGRKVGGIKQDGLRRSARLQEQAARKAR